MSDQAQSLERPSQAPDRQAGGPVEGIVLTPQQLRSRRNRNIAIGLAVAFFVLLFYVVTIAKLGLGVVGRPA